MVVAGDAAAVIETTSHGLALGRVDAIAYDVAILTNLTHEHLELHGTWEAYRDAKLRLFEKLLGARASAGRAPSRSRWPATGIVNADDPSAGAFIGVAQEAGARVLTYGTDPAADVRATRIEEDRRACASRTRRRPARRPLELQLVGRFNVHNALAVVALGEAVGLDPAAVREGLASRPARARADGAGRRSASRSGSSSTSPTARRRSRRCSTCSRRWRPRAAAGSSRSSARPASATRPSGR